MTHRIAIAGAACLVGMAFACSDPKLEEVPVEPPETTYSIPRHDLLGSVDLSDEAVEKMTREELWEVGVEFLLWPADVPEESTKTGILDRLIEAKYRDVGDSLDYEDSGYSEE